MFLFLPLSFVFPYFWSQKSNKFSFLQSTYFASLKIVKAIDSPIKPNIANAIIWLIPSETELIFKYRQHKVETKNET
jgi:hypothetical protein